MEPYTYTPLPETGYIRALSVKPLLPKTDDIHCTMHTIAIGKATQYYALSYSWGMDGDGDATPCKHINIDGRSFTIGRNLYDGLRRIFTAAVQPPPIWIDALCIDQSNIPERNIQVAMMGSIYSNAEKVIVWLGEGDEAENGSIATVLECLRHRQHEHYHEHFIHSRDGAPVSVCLVHAGIAAATAINTLWTKRLEVPDDCPKTQPACIRELFNVDKLKEAATEVQRVLTHFAMKRYWTRRWVVQEIFHADHNETYILWGEYSIYVRQLQSAFLRISRKSIWEEVGEVLNMHLGIDDDAIFSEATNRLKAMLGLRGWAGNPLYPRGNQLADSLAATHGYNCSDARDRVYALLSMDLVTTILPDYRLGTAEVYVAFFRDLIKNDAYLSGLLLSAGEERALESTTDEIAAALPSWCLDLRRPFQVPHMYSALAPCWSDDRNQLTCSALILGVLGDDRQSLVTMMKQPPYRLPAVHGIEHKAGDLVCMFHDVDYDICLNAVILQPDRHDDDKHMDYRIVGYCSAQADRINLQGIELREVRIR